jgi:RNA polymerase sigma-70 factor (ECF subfamily)
MDTIPEELGEDLTTKDLFNSNEDLHEKQIENLGEAIQHLNQEQKTCIELFYLQKLSYRDIEEKTGFNFQQVKSHIQNGKRNLRIFLEQKQKVPGHE